MVGRRPTLPHAELAAFIRSNETAASSSLSTRVQQEEPVYQTLFELIALCQAQAHLPRPAHPGKYPQTFFELEELLSCVYAQAASPEEAGQILDGLLASPSFYQRLLGKLEILAPQAEWEEAAALEGIVVKSDAELMEIVKRSRPEPKEAFDIRKLSALVLGIAGAVAQALEFFRRKPAYAFAVPLLVVVAFAVNNYLSRDLSEVLAQAHYDFPGEWRETTPGAKDSLLGVFKSRFLNAMGGYVSGNYGGTVARLGNLEQLAFTLQSQTHTPTSDSLLREYYFYLGVSHLMLTADKASRLTETEKSQHRQQAIRYLTAAYSLAEAHRFPESDRETFRLGLAYGFSKQYEKAREFLDKVPDASPHRRDRDRLLSAWSKQ